MLGTVCIDNIPNRMNLSLQTPHMKTILLMLSIICAFTSCTVGNGGDDHCETSQVMDNTYDVRLSNGSIVHASDISGRMYDKRDTVCIEYTNSRWIINDMGVMVDTTMVLNDSDTSKDVFIYKIGTIARVNYVQNDSTCRL
jgi:hypothetical protein